MAARKTASIETRDFRVHWRDGGEAMPVAAETPQDARDIAEAAQPGRLIAKVKVDREAS